MEEIQHRFREQFGTDPVCVTRAPGRVEVLGNHTDYNQGLVMALAVDKFVTLAASPRSDGEVHLASTAFEQQARFPVDRIEKDPAASWADYTKGLLLQLQQRGVRPGGFNALIHSTVPLGAGLSSSAALLVASALSVRKLYPYVLESDHQGRMTDAPAPEMTDTERLSLAKMCQAAENQFVGVNCGLLDHISSLFGKAHHVIRIDCLHLTVDHDPLPADVAVVVCHSGVRHALVGGEYNERRALCERAAAKLGVPALRFVDLEGLEAGRAKLTEREYGCALHVVGENTRVQRGAAALETGDLQTFGRLLYESHESSRVNFLNSCPELDVLVELAKRHPACIGARLSGGGFGGATFNLVRADDAEAFRAHLLAGYREQTGREAQAWICDVVEGAA